jgi:hypothetical protein
MFNAPSTDRRTEAQSAPRAPHRPAPAPVRRPHHHGAASLNSVIAS